MPHRQPQQDMVEFLKEAGVAISFKPKQHLPGKTMPILDQLNSCDSSLKAGFRVELVSASKIDAPVRTLLLMAGWTYWDTKLALPADWPLMVAVGSAMRLLSPAMILAGAYTAGKARNL